MKEPFFRAVYNPKRLRQLSKQFGPLLYHHVDLAVSGLVLGRMMQKAEDKKKPRRGEVVMVIPNEAGQFWLHTKDFYPPGVYRLMSGGLEVGENPLEALRREAFEEAGFQVKVERCLAVVTYRLTGPDVAIPFVSYVFLTSPGQNEPHPTDPSEMISHFRAVSLAGLFDAAHQLRRLEGDFADWGIFRAVAHELAATALQAYIR